MPDKKLRPKSRQPRQPKPLSAADVEFAYVYAETANAREAGERAGVTRHRTTALLRNPQCITLVKQRAAEMASAARLDRTSILGHLADVIRADPNEVVTVRKECCRYCYGFDGKYQWTVAEYANATRKAVEGGTSAPDFSGGAGFNPTLKPRVGCTECFGEGASNVVIGDTHSKLYAGAKYGKYGIEVLLHDQHAAVTLASKLLHLTDSKLTVEIKNPSSVEEMDEVQLLKIINGAA